MWNLGCGRSNNDNSDDIYLILAIFICICLIIVILTLGRVIFMVFNEFWNINMGVGLGVGVLIGYLFKSYLTRKKNKVKYDIYVAEKENITQTFESEGLVEYKNLYMGYYFKDKGYLGYIKENIHLINVDKLTSVIEQINIWKDREIQKQVKIQVSKEF